MRQVHTERVSTTMKSQAQLHDLKSFFTEYLGASSVSVGDDDHVEVCFSHTDVDPDDGEKDRWVETATLKSGERLANIKELARAMRETFQEKDYPK